MALRKRPIATGIATLLFTGYVSALGLGEIKLNSALNEPLDAEIPLLNLGELSEDEIIAGLATNADFVNAGVEKELILTTLVFDLDMKAPGGPTLRILSKKPIREPYLDFLVDVQWPSGRLLREFTLLLDLPVYAGEGTSKKKINQPVVQRPTGYASGRSAGSAPVATTPRPTQNVIAGDQQYVVQGGDTLWRIASSLNTDSSMQQRMDAILQINPDAFINGDINLLREGAVLRLPDYGEMHSQLSGQSSASSEASQYSPQLTASSRQENTSPPVATGGRLTLEAGDDSGTGESSLGTGSGSLSGIRGDISLLQEELDKSRRENSDLKGRLSSLEEQITTMQKLIEIGDDEMRAAQLAGLAQAQPVNENASSTEGAKAAETGESASSAGVAAPGGTALEDAEVDSPALALFPSANVSSKPGNPAPDSATGDGQSLQTDTQAENALADGASATAGPSAAAAETVAPKAPTATPASAPTKTGSKTEEGWFDKVNGFLTILLGLVVVLIGAGVVYVLRKRKSSDEDYRAPAQSYTPPPAVVRDRPRVEPRVSQATSIDDIDLDEGDDLFAQAAVEPAAKPSFKPAPAPESLDDMELDLSEFDLDEPEANVKADSSPRSGQVSTPASDGLNLDEEFDFLGDIDEGDTQLELAQAYIEMGDQAGAREILLEVAEGGSDPQKDKARQLLGQLG